MEKSVDSSQFEQNQEGENEEKLPITRASGLVKWFDVARGYGFIIPDNGLEDILIHLSCLKRDGYNAVSEGTLITCDIVQRQKGWQVVKIIDVDETTAIKTVKEQPIVQFSDDAVSQWTIVNVKWFNYVRGYGFLSLQNDHHDIFIHIETLRQNQIAELIPGQKLYVRYGKGPKGLIATHITLNQPDNATTDQEHEARIA